MKIVLILVLSWAAIAEAAAAPLSAAEKRGRAIYLGGDDATALVAGSELPASSLPCGSCHGPDGRGVPEGTIEPPDIRASTLAQPRVDGKLRPRYDDALLRRAITAGIDAAGNPLSPVMPRYRIEAIDDLLAYLRRLGDSAQPGLTDTEIVVGTAAPRGEAVIAAYFQEVNEAGGIFGRHLRLERSTDPDRVFAIVGGSHDDPYERVPALTPFHFEGATATTFFVFRPQAVPELTSDGVRELEAFVVRHDLPREQRAANLVMYATAKVFVEGLKRAGRDLTRESLVASLKGLYGFSTGVTPPIK